jgi:hypothetical protein
VRTPLRRARRLDRICKWTVETGSGTEPLHGRVAADKWVIEAGRIEIGAPLNFTSLLLAAGHSVEKNCQLASNEETAVLTANRPSTRNLPFDRLSRTAVCRLVY